MDQAGPLPRASELGPEMDQLTHSVIAAAIEVHRQLGPGLDESLYEAAMVIEFRLRNIEFARQVIVNVDYKGESIGERRLDFVIEKKLLVELKAVEQLAPVHKAQVLTYLKITGLTLGLLINFNVEVLRDGVKRVIAS